MWDLFDDWIGFYFCLLLEGFRCLLFCRMIWKLSIVFGSWRVRGGEDKCYVCFFFYWMIVVLVIFCFVLVGGKVLGG